MAPPIATPISVLYNYYRTLSASISSGQAGSRPAASQSGSPDHLAAMEGRLNHHLSEMRLVHV